jgi:hypothetical protein
MRSDRRRRPQRLTQLQGNACLYARTTQTVARQRVNAILGPVQWPPVCGANRYSSGSCGRFAIGQFHGRKPCQAGLRTRRAAIAALGRRHSISVSRNQIDWRPITARRTGGGRSGSASDRARRSYNRCPSARYPGPGKTRHSGQFHPRLLQFPDHPCTVWDGLQ